MTSSTLKNCHRFPLWATFTITLVVLVFVAIYAFGVLTIQAVQRFSKELMDQNNVLVVAQSIAQFPETLPDHYTYRLGASITPEQVKKWFGFPAKSAPSAHELKEGYNILALESTDDDQQVIIVSTPQEEPKPADELLRSAFNQGVSPGASTVHFNSVKTKGTQTIAGHEMPYIVGRLESGNGKPIEGMIACLTLKDPNRAIIVYGLQKIGGDYDLAETLDLLKSIKAF